MIPEINWGAAVTNPAYQFYTATGGLIGSPVVASGGTHIIWPAVTPPDTAHGIKYTCTEFGPEYSVADLLLAKLATPDSPAAPVIVVPSPTAPGTATGYLTVRDSKGAAVNGIDVEFQVLSVPGSDSYRLPIEKTTSSADVSPGAAIRDFPQGATVRARLPHGQWLHFTVPQAAVAFAIGQLITTV